MSACWFFLSGLCRYETQVRVKELALSVFPKDLQYDSSGQYGHRIRNLTITNSAL